MINVDGHTAYARAISELKQSEELGRRYRCRPSPYLNNIIEQDHRFIKKRIVASLGFRSAEGACRTIEGYEAMRLIRKGQIRWPPKGDVVGSASIHPRTLRNRCLIYQVPEPSQLKMVVAISTCNTSGKLLFQHVRELLHFATALASLLLRVARIASVAAALAAGTITIVIHRHTTVSLGTSFSHYHSKKVNLSGDGIILPHIWRIDPIKDQLQEEPE